MLSNTSLTVETLSSHSVDSPFTISIKSPILCTLRIKEGVHQNLRVYLTLIVKVIVVTLITFLYMY